MKAAALCRRACWDSERVKSILCFCDSCLSLGGDRVGVNVSGDFTNLDCQRLMGKTFEDMETMIYQYVFSSSFNVPLELGCGQ